MHAGVHQLMEAGLRSGPMMHQRAVQQRLQLQEQLGPALASVGAPPGMAGGYGAALPLVNPTYLRSQQMSAAGLAPAGAAAALPWHSLGRPAGAAGTAALAQAHLPPGVPAEASGADAGGGAAKGKQGPRAGFKISELESMFNSGAFLDRVCSVARDQAGCRMLQLRLEKAVQQGNTEMVGAILDRCLSSVVDLMMDPFGNYLCQKLMELCTAQQLEAMVERTRGSLVKVSLNLHGARAVQKLIEAAQRAPNVQRQLALALDGAVVELSQSPNGNHVVCKCLEALPAEFRPRIFQAVSGSIVGMASDRHGCRIVQRCIDLSEGEGRYWLTKSVTREALTLVQDPFGNYAVQYVLKLEDPQANSDVISAMLGRLSVLSRQKFSSNVVEACLRSGAPHDTERMIRELADPQSLSELLRDVFGNYVVQSALSVAAEPLLGLLLKAVQPCLPALRASGGQGRRIAQKLEKKYPQLRADRGSPGALPGAVSQPAGGDPPAAHVAAAKGLPPMPPAGPVTQPPHAAGDRARRSRPRREGPRAGRK